MHVLATQSGIGARSGKSGLLRVMMEEALLAGVPILAIDVKGDLPNLLLPYTTLEPESMLPWIEGQVLPPDPCSSHLFTWRRLAKRGETAALTPKKRGPLSKATEERDKPSRNQLHR